MNFYKDIILRGVMGCKMHYGVRSKRAQFFILAAVIISAVIISFGLTSNMARVNKEPENFYDLAFEVKKETGAVMDYAIFNCGPNGPFACGDDGAMVDFVRLMAGDVLGKDPDATFIFIYGNQADLKMKNYGARDAETSDEEGETTHRGRGGRSTQSTSVRVGDTTFFTEQDIPWGEFRDDEEIPLDLKGESSFDILIAEQEYTFEVSEYNQVIFILEKEADDENFVSIS